MEFEFEFQDYVITMDIEAGFDYDDPAEWTLQSIEYVDGAPCEFEQLPATTRQQIESACETWAGNKAYDAWIDRANSRADYLISKHKDGD